MHDPDLTNDRIRRHTPRPVNDEIDREAADRLRALEGAPPHALRERLAELDREWDVDRALMANFAIVGGLAFALGLRGLRRRGGTFNGWLGLLSVQLPFLLLHATYGWCPPLPVFRRLGFRTRQEIGRERLAVQRRFDHHATVDAALIPAT